MIKIEQTATGFALVADKGDELKDFHERVGQIFTITHELATSWQVKRIEFTQLVPKDKSK